MSVTHGEPNTLTPFAPPLPAGFDRRDAILGRIGSLVVRLAKNDDEIWAAQKIRHQIFHTTDRVDNDARDADHFDAFCDHLIVIDTDQAGPVRSKIVGTYRLLRSEPAALAGGFYSQGEFDIAGFAARMPRRRILELGRSCVVPEYRSRRAVELLWQGILACCRLWSVDVLCGCASFAGTTPAIHALPLSYLHHFARAKGEWAVRGHKPNRITMDLMPSEAIHVRDALLAMPPLIKGYLRVGAFFGEEAVIDPIFGTTDVFVILPVEHIAPRYINHFSVDAARLI